MNLEKPQLSGEATQSGDAYLRYAELADRIKAELDAGHTIDVDELVALYPEYADEVRKIAPSLAALYELGYGGHNRTSHDADHLGALGDFRITREIGRGGMGAVYEAEQISLRRRVALKILPFAAVMDARQLQRFKNEAMAAANLSHPHIVDVYAIGCERGIHFYAMRYIEGQSMAELIAQLRQLREDDQHVIDGSIARLIGSSSDLPTTTDETRARADSTTRSGKQKNRHYYQSIAALFADTAEALDHAHRNGVVHRDIKPSNLLLDAEGTIWVADFGLAHLDTDAGLTMTGDLIGTLRYMSPEQVMAKRVPMDHRTDIYSLGATLYELLSLDPAIRGDDRQEILRQITFEEPPPLRKCDPTIPNDLETIVLKAMEKNPAHRYASCQEMADDLRRFFHDQPIQAQPPTLRSRLAKWSRRHQAIVYTAAVALALFVLTLLPLAVWLWFARADAIAQRDLLEEARREAVAERNLADQLSDDVISVLEILADPRQEPGSSGNSLGALGDDAFAAFTQAINTMKEIRERRPVDPAVARRLVTLRRNYATLLNRSGNPVKAASLLSAAVQDAERLLTLEKDNLDSLVTLITVRKELADILQGKLGQWQEARKLYETCMPDIDRLLRESPGVQHTEMAVALKNNLAGGLLEEGQLDQAKTEIQAAISLCRQALLPEGRGNEARMRYILGMAVHTLATIEEEQGSQDEADRLYREAIKSLGEGVARYPQDINLCVALASAYKNHALHSRRHGDASDTRTGYDKAITIYDQLLVQHPGAVRFIAGLAGVYGSLADFQEAQGDLEECTASYLKAKALMQQIVELVPDSSEYRHDLAVKANNLAEVYLQRGDKAHALQEIDEVVAAHGKNAELFPEILRFQLDLIESEVNRGMIQRRFGRTSAARDSADKAIASLAELASKHSPSDRITYLQETAQSLLRSLQE